MNGKEYKLMVRIAGEIDKTFTGALNNTRKEIKKVKQMTADETFSVLDQGFNKIESVGKKALNTIKRTAELAAVAVAGIGTAATNAGMEFEAAMSTVQAISGADNSQLDELTEKARELSRNSIYSGTEVADAMQYMGMAGWKTEQILAGIEPVLNLATASGEEFAMVSDIVTDNLTAFNMTAEEAGRMADVMAAAAMNSNTNVEKMGATFKYAGSVAGALDFSIEDVAIATGLMASSGVKANMAGTALRNIFTRMVKPTKDAQKAMDAFGVSITEIDPETGKEKIKSLMDIMLQMRESVSGKSQEEIKKLVSGLSGGELSAEEKKYYENLSEDELDALVLAEELSEAEKEAYNSMTQVEKAYYAAGLAGQRGMTGLLTILNASDEDFKNLTEAIYGSAGAAEYMANVKVDNLKGDLSILKNNISDAGIELYGTYSGTLRELVQGATEWIRDNIKNIPKWVDQISAHMATLKRKASKYLEPVFDIVIGGGKWLIKNKSLVIGVLAGIGTTLAAYKVVSGITHTVTAISSFITAANPLTLVLTGIAAAIGVITGAIAAYKAQERELIDNDLAEHFGNISLTMKDLDEVARAIVDNGYMTELKRQLETFDELDVLRDDIQSHFDKINKITWKVSLGFELTGDLKEEYLSEVQEAAKAQQDYAVDTTYAVTQLFPGEDAISQKVRKFYTDNMETMQELGKQLAELVNGAYEKELLNTDDIEAIARKQQEMAEIQRTISLNEQDAKLALLTQKEGGAALDAESFANLQEELNNVLKENEEVFNEYYIKKYAAIKAAEEAARKAAESGGPEFVESEWTDAILALNEEKVLNIAEQRKKSLEFQMQAIGNAYGEELETYRQERDNLLKEYLDPSEAFDWDLESGRSAIKYYEMMMELFGDESKISDITRKAVKERIESLEDTLKEYLSMSGTKGLSDETRKMLEEQINTVKDEISELMSFTGYYNEGTDADIYEALNKMLEEGSLDEGQAYVAEEIKRFLHYNGSEYLTETEEEINKCYAETKRLIEEAYADGFDVNPEVRVHLGQTVDKLTTVTSYNVFGSDTPDYIRDLYAQHNARGGLINNETLSWLAEDGPEMVIPLDGSRRALELWQQAGQFLNGSLFGNNGGNSTDGISDKLSASAGNSEINIEYNPTLQFYGEAPSRDDLTDALRLSQDEFETMMERYLKKNARLAF